MRVILNYFLHPQGLMNVGKREKAKMEKVEIATEAKISTTEIAETATMQRAETVEVDDKDSPQLQHLNEDTEGAPALAHDTKNNVEGKPTKATKGVEVVAGAIKIIIKVKNDRYQKRGEGDSIIFLILSFFSICDFSSRSSRSR